MQIETAATSINIQQFSTTVKVIYFTRLQCEGIKLRNIRTAGSYLRVFETLNAFNIKAKLLCAVSDGTKIVSGERCRCFGKTVKSCGFTNHHTEPSRQEPEQEFSDFKIGVICRCIGQKTLQFGQRQRRDQVQLRNAIARVAFGEMRGYGTADFH